MTESIGIRYVIPQSQFPNMNINNSGSPLPEFVERGVQSIGRGGGVLLGSTLIKGGLEGAVLGASLGPWLTAALHRLILEFNSRFLSGREEKRVVSVLYYAAQRIEQRRDSGDTLRADDFFDEETDRSSGEEVLEGGIISAQREHEERKIEYIGYLLASICFDSSIDQSRANVLIDTAERMSWRQMMLLSYLNRLSEFALCRRNPPEIDSENLRHLESPPFDFLHEAAEAQRMRILMGVEAYLGYPYEPRKYAVSTLGKRLYTLMELDRIAHSELEELESLCMFGRYRA